MKAITFEAPQSRNLSQAAYLNDIKSAMRRVWLRSNVVVRNWSRRAVAKYETLLVWVGGIAAVAGFFFAILEYNVITVIFALIAIASMAPEMTKSTYDKIWGGVEI